MEFSSKMECYACGGKGSLEHSGRSICKKCFLRNMEKRVKKHLGREKFKRGDKVLVVGELEKFLVEKVIKGMPLEIVFKERLPRKRERFDWVVAGKTMDDIDEEFLEGLFKGELKLGKLGKKFFNLLEPLTEEEAKKYAELKGIKLKVKERKGEGGRFLEGLKEFKEIKYNLYKNIKELREKL